MNKLDLFCKLYGILRNYGMPIWVMTPIRRGVRFWVNKKLPNYLLQPRKIDCLKQTDVIVSLTSFPARITNVWQVVECMLRQTYQPAKVLLWLSKDQFPTEESIPEHLREMQNKIFEIRMVDGDIRSHKKYLYVSREFPNSSVMLIDDDIYYPTDFIQRFYESYQKHHRVICIYGNIIQYNENGSVKGYKQWIPTYKEILSDDFFFGSGGGVLFVPSLLYHDLTNINLAMRLCPLADDIWLNAMVRLGGQTTIKLKSGLFLPLNEEENVTLASANLSHNKNDEQLQALNEYYQKELGSVVFGKKLM